MLSRSIRHRIRNTKTRTTKKAVRGSVYLKRPESVTQWLGTESNRRHADFQEACRSTVSLRDSASRPELTRICHELTLTHLATREFTRRNAVHADGHG